MKITPRQQAAFKLMLEKFQKHEPAILGEIMREVGYSTATSINPGANLVKTVAWQSMKRELDSGGARDTFNELVSPRNTDKRTRLAAAIEITKITDGYRKAESKVIGLFEKVGELQTPQADDKSNTVTVEDKLLTTSGTAEGIELPE